jgi:V/A-type H+-transporting ATPase subunit D
MAKIKHTKNELKTQRESLKRFARYLPMLILKKQLLQAEIQAIEARVEEKVEEERKLREDLDRWVRLFSESSGVEDMTTVLEIKISVGNIAGVALPLYEDVIFQRRATDLFETPAWTDAGVDMIERMIRVRIAVEIYREQLRRVGEELRTTTQRVNLFEKVKIPECKEHIRVIRIFLGDEQTAAVARGKIAKSRLDTSATANAA